MTRYQALRRIGLDPIGAGFIALVHRFYGVPAGRIHFMTVTIEYEP